MNDITTVIIIIAAVLLILTLAGAAGGWLMYRRAFSPERDASRAERKNLQELVGGPLRGRAEFVRQGRLWVEAQPARELYMTNREGLRLHARYISCAAYAARPTGRVLLMAHGYHSCAAFDFGCGCPFYLSLGYDLCLVDQRAHGQSQGQRVCFGVRESADMVDWCRFLLDQEPQRPIVLAGISMGATSMLLAAGRPDLPPGVLGVIADCGFTDCREQFRDVLAQMHLPRFPLMNWAEFFCRRELGFGFSDHSTLDAVARMPIPVIFFHGLDDKFVPPRNSQQNYAACQAPHKRLVLVPGAGHGQSFLADEPGCRAALTEFLAAL